jgi:hypothetical protein
MEPLSVDEQLQRHQERGCPGPRPSSMSQ